MKKFAILGVFITALFSFAACSSTSNKVNPEAKAEMAFPENSFITMMFDHSNKEQKANLEDVLSRFPDIDLFDALMEEIKADLESEDFDQEVFDELMASNFRIGLSVDFPSDVTSLDEIENSEEPASIVVAGEFEESDRIEELMDKLMEEAYVSEGQDVEREVDGELVYWTVVEDDFYAVRYGDIFVVASEEKGRSNAVDSFGGEEGLYANEVFQGYRDSFDEGSLGYVYLDFSDLWSLIPDEEMADIETMMSVYGNNMDLISEMEGFLMTLSVDEGGFMLSTIADMGISESDLAGIIPGFDQSLKLVEKVNNEGVIMYGEDQSFAFVFKTLLTTYAVIFDSAFTAYESAMMGEGHEFPDPSIQFSAEEQEETYQMIMTQLAGLGGLSVEEMEIMLDTPFAMSFSNPGTLIPAIAFYLDLDEETRDLAKDYVEGLNGFVDATMGELQYLLPPEAEGRDVIKKEKVVVEGGVLYKLHLDWTAFSEETLAGLQFAPGFDLLSQKVELYYGVTGNDVLAFALYPDFAEGFGEEVIADLENYEDGLKRLGGMDPYSVSFVQVDPILDMIESYLDIANSAGVLTGDDLKDFELYGRQFFGTFKYMIAAKEYEDGLMRSDLYLRVQKVN